MNEAPKPKRYSAKSLLAAMTADTKVMEQLSRAPDFVYINPFEPSKAPRLILARAAKRVWLDNIELVRRQAE